MGTKPAIMHQVLLPISLIQRPNVNIRHSADLLSSSLPAKSSVDTKSYIQSTAFHLPFLQKAKHQEQNSGCKIRIYYFMQNSTDTILNYLYGVLHIIITTAWEIHSQ